MNASAFGKSGHSTVDQQVLFAAFPPLGRAAATKPQNARAAKPAAAPKLSIMFSSQLNSFYSQRYKSEANGCT